MAQRQTRGRKRTWRRRRSLERRRHEPRSVCAHRCWKRQGRVLQERLLRAYGPACVLSHGRLFVTPQTVACQVSLPAGILQARILEWVPFPSPEDLPHLGTEPKSPASQADSLPSEPPGKPLLWPSVQFSSVAQLSPTLCDPMNRSTPGLPVHHQLPEFTQTHVHRVGDAIQPSHPLSSPSLPAPNPSQHHGLFQWVNSSHEVAKVLEFQLQHQSFQWTPRTDLL